MSADVSASTPDHPLVSWALHTLSDHSIDARLAGIVVPPALDTPANVAIGAQIFAANCMVCHGGPGLPPSNIAQGLNPAPPDLFKAGRQPWMEENFRFIKYGIKMTAMPAFGKTQTNEQIWQLATFLRQAPGLSHTDFMTQTGIPVLAPSVPRPIGG